MRIIRAKDYEEMSRKAADVISAVMTLQPQCVLGLATGSSPVGTYRHLVQRYENGDLDFSGVTTVNLDEYRGLDRENPQSYYWFMKEQLFSKVNVLPEHTHIPDGTEEDSQKACASYNEILEQAGQIDLQLLGIGHDGHIGFNEPADHFEQFTHCVQLTDMTIEANARFFASREEVPTEAYTMGIGTIMSARRVLMVASGADKAAILKTAFCGPVTPEVPASILQMHPDFILIADEAALSEMDR